MTNIINFAIVREAIDTHLKQTDQRSLWIIVRNAPHRGFTQDQLDELKNFIGDTSDSSTLRRSVVHVINKNVEWAKWMTGTNLTV